LLGDIARAGEDEAAAGGQGQLHREEKQHKPVLKKVKEKVKKIKNTLAGHGHGGERGPGDAAGSTSSEEGEEDAAEREAALERGGYMEDVEDKPVVTESDPEVHGAPSKCHLFTVAERRIWLHMPEAWYSHGAPATRCSVRVGAGTGRAGPRREVRSGEETRRAGGGRRRHTRGAARRPRRPRRRGSRRAALHDARGERYGKPDTVLATLLMFIHSLHVSFSSMC
jgi:hypothetical protein